MAENHRLRCRIHQVIIRISAAHDAVAFHHIEHVAVEKAELRIAQTGIVGERPLSPGIPVTPSVPLARKIYPPGWPNSFPMKLR